jgi:hypothetical protein
MTPLDERGACTDPLTAAIAHAFEVYDLDDIEAQDGDMLRGLARLAGATIHENYQRFTEWMDADERP